MMTIKDMRLVFSNVSMDAKEVQRDLMLFMDYLITMYVTSSAFVFGYNHYLLTFCFFTLILEYKAPLAYKKCHRGVRQI